MYTCNHCNGIFEEPKKNISHEPIECWGRNETYEVVELVCPTCGDEDIEELEYYDEFEDEDDEEDYIETDGEYEEDE